MVNKNKFSVYSYLLKRCLLILFVLAQVQYIDAQKNSKDNLVSQLIKSGDELTSNYEYEKAIPFYKKALENQHEEDKYYTQPLLKLWESYQKNFEYTQDESLFALFNKCKNATDNETIKAAGLIYRYWVGLEKYDLAYESLMRVKKLALSLENTDFLINLSGYYAYVSNYSEASKLAFHAIKYAEKQGRHDQISKIYLKISRYYAHQSLFNESKHYANLSIALQQKHNLLEDLGPAYANLMYLYSLDSMSYDSVVINGEKAIFYANKVNDRETEIYILLNMAGVYVDSNQAIAIQYLQRVEDLIKRTNSPLFKMHYLLHRGSFELKAGNYKDAIVLLTDAAQLYKTKNKSEEYLCYEYLMYCYEQMGDYANAFYYSNLKNTSQLFYETEASRKQLLESELKYELEKKDKTLIQNKFLLLAKETESASWLQKFKLKQSENLILNQEQTLAAQKNENLNTQLLLNQKESKLALAQKELAILTKSKNLKTTILIGIALLMVLIGIFIVILWEKIKIQRNLEKILSNAASKMTEAKIELDNFTSIVQDEKQKSPTDLASIQNKFENFEQTITNVISETQNFGFRISHEIKGPLKIIQARLEKISSNLNPDQVQNLNEINHQVFKMQEMGDKLLMLSKIQKFKPELMIVNVEEQILDVMEELQTLYTKEILINFIHKIPLKADPILMKIVWQNLLSNAVKYHDKDEACNILINSFFENNHVIYTFSDNGSGIKNTKVKEINNFNNPSTNHIGLLLVEEIIKKHRGIFFIEKSDTSGTKIKISIPK